MLASSPARPARGPDRSRTRASRALEGLLIAAVMSASIAMLTIKSLGGWNTTAIAVTATAQLLLLSSLIAVIITRRHVRRPIPAGRIVAIVPVFEEAADALDACIHSILNQNDVIVDEIHVVDDGSARNPVQPWPHPRVVWHRKPNGGKRSAHHHVLSLLAARTDPAAFILTVDSDSILDANAAAHLLRAFSDPRITGASGVVYVSNAERNLITRIAEVNIGSAVAVGRATRSLLGSLETTSGALAMYRAGILLNRKDHYLRSGTFGDDRMLTLYAKLEGRVVAVAEAVAYSEMPTTLRGTYRQQLRWAKSKVKLLPFTLTNMPARHLIFPLLSMLRFVLVPVLLAYVILGLLGAPAGRALAVAGTAGAVWLGIRYATVGLYLLGRADQSVRRRILTWVLITPVELLYALLMLFPVQYIALAKLRDKGWGTRGNPGESMAAAPDAADHRVDASARGRRGAGSTRPSRARRSGSGIGSLVAGVLVLLASGSLLWQGIAERGALPAAGAGQLAGLDMNGRPVRLDAGTALAAEQAGPRDAAPEGTGRFAAPSAGLSVQLESMNAVDGIITPPGFASAYWVANVGAAPSSPAAGTVYIAMHSLRWGAVGPGNYLYDPDTGAAKVARGASIDIDGHSYLVDSTTVIGKTDLPTASSIWADQPGRLVVITCLQRADNTPATENFVITAHLDDER